MALDVFMSALRLVVAYRLIIKYFLKLKLI